MDLPALEATLKSHLAEICERATQAASIANAAMACAESGNIQKAIEIVLDLEQLTYEINTLLNAASLMNRIYRT